MPNTPARCSRKLATPTYHLTLLTSYPTPVRGTTLGRACTTWFGLAPPRPSIPPGMPPPAPMPPIGIGIIPMPPPTGAPAAAAAPGISPPIPDIAALTIRDGADPCHVGGTDIAPTSRALPNPASAPPRPPMPPPSPFWQPRRC